MSWERVALEDIAKIVGGSTPRRDNPVFWNGDIPWLTPTDLPPLGSGVASITDTDGHITAEGLQATSLTMLPPSTVVFSSRATIGKVGVAEVPITTNQGFVNLIPSDRIYSRYLAWVLLQHADQIAALSGSTTFKEVSRTSVKRFTIPLPPLGEQHRIADLLDRADRLQRLRAEATQKSLRMLPALFLEMFGDPATNPRGWDTRALGDIAEVVTGNTPSRKVQEYYAHDIEWIKPGDLGNSVFPPSGAEEWLSEAARGVARVVPSGSVLVTCIAGSIGSVGNVSLLDREAAFNQQINALVAKECVLPLYLYGLLRTAPSLVKGVVAQNMQFIVSKSRMAGIRVPVPPKTLQGEFATRANLVGATLAAQARADAHYRQLAGSLRSRLFSRLT